MREYDHSRSYSSESLVVEQPEIPERTPEQKRQDAILGAERQLSSVEARLVELDTIPAPRIWEAKYKSLDEEIATCQTGVDHAKEIRANAREITTLEVRLAAVKAGVEKAARPEGFTPVPLESELRAALTAKPEGSARDGHDRKEATLHALFERLDVAESRALTWRIKAHLPEDSLVAAFYDLPDEQRRARLKDVLEDAARREAVALEPARRAATLQASPQATSHEAAAFPSPAVDAERATPTHETGLVPKRLAEPGHGLTSTREAVTAAPVVDTLEVKLARVLEAGEPEASVEPQLMQLFGELGDAARHELDQRFKRYRPGNGDAIVARFMRLEPPVRRRLLGELTAPHLPASHAQEHVGSGEASGHDASHASAPALAEKTGDGHAAHTAPTSQTAQHGHIDTPRSGINKVGFIDTSDGAKLRTRPAELGGQELVDRPLPPATRVFASGTHPETSQWWYVTAYLKGAMVRGYVQGFRVNTELPEPTAELHQVVGGETAEGLARAKFGKAVRDGHDLRYYENVLFYVNHVQDPTHSAGITGTYQDPGVLGAGSNNVQLMANHRIWLVSPDYANALERLVPSGSLTGGAVAKARRFVGHLEDILHSVTRSPQYLGTVAGTYAQAIRDHEAEIIGITAGFIAAEATSMFLAATPTGVGQIAAVVIQLALSAFGASGMVLAVAEATKHATEWLTMAWTAKGKDDAIAAASKEFLKMLVALALAALAARGAKANYGNALKIANSMPTGGLPTLASAGAGNVGAGSAGADGSIGAETGSLAAAGNAMQRVDDDAPGSLFDPREGDNASFADEPEHEPENVCELEDVRDQLPHRYGDLSEHGGVSVREARNAGVVPEAGAEPMDRHHIFPQSAMRIATPEGKVAVGGRSWFDERGVDIDEFCVDLSDFVHDIIHGGNQELASVHWRQEEWRSAILDRLAKAESDLKIQLGPEAKLSREAILEIGKDLMARFKIADRPFVHYTKIP